MIVIISLHKPCYEILQHTLALRKYHAQDVALCTDTPLQTPLPHSCHASQELCLIHCPTIREMHFSIGTLYPALPLLKTFVYALPQNTTQKLCAAHSVQNSGGHTRYLDMLHAWYEDEVALRDDGAYEFTTLVQRYWNSNHAQIMLMPHVDSEDTPKVSKTIQTHAHAILKAFARLQSMPTNTTGNMSKAIVQSVHASAPGSFTERKQLYNFLRAQEIQHGEIPQKLRTAIDEAIHKVEYNTNTSYKRKAFATLLTKLKEHY